MSDPPHRYQAARFLADLTQDADELSAIEGALTYAAATDSSPPNPSTLAELTPDIASARQYRELRYHLEEAGVIDDTGAAASELRAIFDTARIFAERGPLPTNHVVANTPLDDDDIGDSIGSLVVNLLDLIQKAESELVILNPFFTEEGYDQIGAPISDATARGVDVTIITKSLTYGGSTQNERVVRELFQEDDTVPRNLTLYEYVLDDNPDEEHPPTIHAKLTIADGERAYLGTANMTHRGLVENLELGVIFQNDTVGDLLELVQDLLSSEYLHPVDYTSSGFERR
jgi:phosphatidylserine/phosphatidylglycerophosphate/cardiolipin synthase-like enzyme